MAITQSIVEFLVLLNRYLCCFYKFRLQTLDCYSYVCFLSSPAWVFSYLALLVSTHHVVARQC